LAASSLKVPHQVPQRTGEGSSRTASCGAASMTAGEGYGSHTGDLATAEIF
jgi:hypothetical protein